jgi:hypothetical protein
MARVVGRTLKKSRSPASFPFFSPSPSHLGHPIFTGNKRTEKGGAASTRSAFFDLPWHCHNKARFQTLPPTPVCSRIAFKCLIHAPRHPLRARGTLQRPRRFATFCTLSSTLKAAPFCPLLYQQSLSSPFNIYPSWQQSPTESLSDFTKTQFPSMPLLHHSFRPFRRHAEML